MNQEQMREFMKSSGDFEEIDFKEYCANNNNKVLCIPFKDGNNLYYKAIVKETFPIIFEDLNRRIEIDEDGNFTTIDKLNNASIYWRNSILLLKQIIAKSDDIKARNNENSNTVNLTGTLTNMIIS